MKYKIAVNILSNDEFDGYYTELIEFPNIPSMENIREYIMKQPTISVYCCGLTKEIKPDNIVEMDVTFVICQEPFGFIDLK